MRQIAAALILLSLAACGARGALELPAGPAPTPLFGSQSAAGAQGLLAAKDVSTPNRTNAQ